MRVLKRLSGVMAALLAMLLMVGSASAATMNGYDVSNYQSETVTRDAPGDFAIMEVTEGGFVVNRKWDTQTRYALASGKQIGLYHYAGGGVPEAEAEYFTAHVKPYVGRAMLVLDWESTFNPAFGDGTWIRRYVNRVHELTNVWPVVYTSAAYVSQIPSDVRQNCGLWVAQYASNAATGYQASPWNLGASGEMMRQYSSSGYLNGVGPLDLDKYLGDSDSWQRYANPGAASTHRVPSVPQAKAQVEQATGRYCVVVRPGDTLSAIASRSGRNPWSAWSGYASGNPNVLRVGETVCYGGSAATTVPASGYYVVRSGDYLSRIWPNSWQTIAALNGLRSPYTIYPGQVLKTTGAVTTSGRYTVRSGDTVSGIAAKLGVSVSAIHGYANINLIYPGQVLTY
jgi:LysM repeat protein